MKKNGVLIICLLFLFFSLINEASAQACGTYFIRIKVKDTRGKPVNNAVFELTPLEKDETRGKQFVRDKSDASLFSIDYPEGYSFTSFHQLRISANGFKPATNKVVFTSCANRDVTVKLAPENSDAEAVWQFAVNVSIAVFGEGDDRRELDNVRMTIFENEKPTEVVEMKFGVKYIELHSGNYLLRFEKAGYETQDVEVEIKALSGKYVKVKLLKEKTASP